MRFTRLLFNKKPPLNDFNSMVSKRIKDEYAVPLERVPGVDDPKDPLEILKIQYNNFKSLERVKTVPRETDVLIIGGGMVGSFIAYWLRTTSPSISVTVIERDSNYTQSSTYWSVGGFRQQFSLPENIKMSLFSTDFLKNAKRNLEFKGCDPLDFDFNHDGYLFLASSQSADTVVSNHKIQLSQEAKVRLYTKNELKNSFKWLNVNDVELGSYGYENEGWIDPRKYLLAVRNKATYLGAEFVNAELIGFEKERPGDNNMVIRSPFMPLKQALVDSFDNKMVPIKFQTVVNAAGPWASEVARMAGIGYPAENEVNLPKSLLVNLPVEPRKRYIYVFYAENGPILKVPLTIDHTGVFFRRLGLSNYYLCGLNQTDEASEPTNMDLNDIDYDYFEKKIKPVLATRVPAFAELKLHGAWSGYYDYNTLDQNLIIGRHPIMENFMFANGSSGHGLQHACAIGHAITEMILFNEYKTIDLKRFGFERVIRNQPIKEIDVV